MSLRTGLLLGLGMAIACQARPVDEDLATRAALAQLPDGGALSVLSSLRAVLPQPDGSPTLWLAAFEGGGFAWIRGDDRLPPLAGWADEGPAPWPVEHPALTDWLELQRRDLEWARAMGWTHPEAEAAWQEAAQGISPREDRTVAPLLNSTWDQGWPWNQYCPADANGPGGHVWTGCVATAMAQILYFWGWPDMGGGSHGYTHRVYGYQFAYFGNTSYAWDQMLPGSATPAGALLQYHCGVAVEMDYSPSGSGAWVGNEENCARDAFASYFRYAPDLDYITHSSYQGAAWALRLAEELEAGRPVLDSGYGSGGHAFVLDGLQGLDQFHVNWGWSGWYNGWYGIEALTPGGMNFSIMQGAIVNLQPDTPPVVTLPDLSVATAQPFPLLQLDSLAVDPHGSLDQLLWWCDENGPFSVVIDDLARTAQVNYPTGWTGSAPLGLCAMDVNGLWSCDTGLLTVLPASLPPAAIEDLRLECLAEGLRLTWTPPATDAGGLHPVQLTGFQVHRGALPWFQPGPATLVAQVLADATSWTDSLPAADLGFYRVIALGE